MENKWIGNKDDGAKARMDLVPPEAVSAMAVVFGYGAAKYADRNWEGGMSWGRVFAALMRHSWAFWRGQDLDPESGYPHVWHMHACTAMLVTYWDRSIGEDNRNKVETPDEH
jgi:hypothetical protein